MTETIISFPAKIKPPADQKPKPDTIEVQCDLGTWAVAYFAGDRLSSRLRLSSKAEAEAEAQRLAINSGFIWRFGRNGIVYVMPHEADGGCWDVAHRSASDASDAILFRHINLDIAINHAICAARSLKAECSLSGPEAP